MNLELGAGDRRDALSYGLEIGDGVESVLTKLVGAGGAGLLGELVEEGVLAVVRGPDGEIATPGDTALGDFPKEIGVGVFGEFVEADIAAVNGHRVGVGGEGDDAGAVIEFDVADFDFFGEGMSVIPREIG